MIVIADLPYTLSGKNTRYGKIVVRKLESKGASFAIYLHELANYLLRRDCVTVADHIENKSLIVEDIYSYEGGNYLEMKLFGSILTQISSVASNY